MLLVQLLEPRKQVEIRNVILIGRQWKLPVLLKKDAYQVVEADSWRKAVSLVEEFVPSLILFESDCPRQSDFEAAINFRNKIKGIPVHICFFIQDGNESTRRAAYESGAEFVFHHTDDPETVLQTLEDALAYG